MSMLHNASLFARLTLLLGVVPLVMAVVYDPADEQHLALMRPLSLAGLFAAISGTCWGSSTCSKCSGARRDGRDVPRDGDRRRRVLVSVRWDSPASRSPGWSWRSAWGGEAAGCSGAVNG